MQKKQEETDKLSMVEELGGEKITGVYVNAIRQNDSQPVDFQNQKHRQACLFFHCFEFLLNYIFLG